MSFQCTECQLVILFLWNEVGTNVNETSFSVIQDCPQILRTNKNLRNHFFCLYSEDK